MGCRTASQYRSNDLLTGFSAKQVKLNDNLMRLRAEIIDISASRGRNTL
jgi:hypothetical protein